MFLYVAASSLVVISRSSFLILVIIQVNLVLDDAVEYSPEGDGLVKTDLQSEILLNGNQIAVLVPGGSGPPEDSLAAQAG